jgi:hypothetical protein
VSNFGDGTINAFDPATGQPLGTLNTSVSSDGLTGTALSVPGLAGIAFGNDVTTQSHDTLFFTAGPNNGVNGLFGRIDLVHAQPLISSITVTPCTAPGCSPGTSTINTDITSQVPIAIVQFFVNGAYYQSNIGWDGPPYWVTWPASPANPPHLITVEAFDMNGNMGTRSVNY